MEKGHSVENNPYITQMDKFTNSIRRLSKTFLHMENVRGVFTSDEVEGIFEKVSEQVCESCDKRDECIAENSIAIYQLIYEILHAADDHGNNLNLEIRRKLQKRCVMAPRFMRETLEAFGEAKQSLAWNNRIVQSREGCAIQLDTFAQMIQHATRELDASIFSDELLEKKLKTRLRRIGVRVLSTVFFMTPKGRYEIHITGKAAKGQCVSTREIVDVLSASTGRTMVLEQDERQVLGEDYCTVICMEGPQFQILQGVAKIGKGCSKISGDSFLMKELPGGMQGAILSDGMGTGEAAFKESAMVVEMLEELLDAGFPKITAIQMMNTALVMGREEVRFSTIDMSVFDLYEGTCEILKVGASTTFIKHGKQIEKIHSTSLPIGVIQNLEVESRSIQMEDGDFVIMVTDGVLDAIPLGQQEYLMDAILKKADMINPKEMAHFVLEQVLKASGEVPVDDMTVLVVGIWSCIL